MTSAARLRAGVLVWSVVFVVPHLYWALGGRAGLGTDRATADAAFDRPWFVAYNLLTVVLTVVGAGLCVAWTRPGRAAPRVDRLRQLALVGAVVLLLRGGVGLVLLLVGSALGDEPWPTPVLVAVEPWFVVGGLLYLLVHRRGRLTPPAGGGG